MVSFKLAQLISVVVVASAFMNIEARVVTRTTAAVKPNDASPVLPDVSGGNNASTDPKNPKQAPTVPAGIANTPNRSPALSNAPGGQKPASPTGSSGKTIKTPETAMISQKSASNSQKQSAQQVKAMLDGLPIKPNADDGVPAGAENSPTPTGGKKAPKDSSSGAISSDEKKANLMEKLKAKSNPASLPKAGNHTLAPSGGASPPPVNNKRHHSPSGSPEEIKPDLAAEVKSKPSAGGYTNAGNHTSAIGGPKTPVNLKRHHSSSGSPEETQPVLDEKTKSKASAGGYTNAGNHTSPIGGPKPPANQKQQHLPSESPEEMKANHAEKIYPKASAAGPTKAGNIPSPIGGTSQAPAHANQADHPVGKAIRKRADAVPHPEASTPKNQPAPSQENKPETSNERGDAAMKENKEHREEHKDHKEENKDKKEHQEEKKENEDHKEEKKDKKDHKEEDKNDKEENKDHKDDKGEHKEHKEEHKDPKEERKEEPKKPDIAGPLAESSETISQY